jgi:hypothetical protein
MSAATSLGLSFKLYRPTKGSLGSLFSLLASLIQACFCCISLIIKMDEVVSGFDPFFLKSFNS